MFGRSRTGLVCAQVPLSPPDPRFSSADEASVAVPAMRMSAAISIFFATISRSFLSEIVELAQTARPADRCFRRGARPRSAAGNPSGMRDVHGRSHIFCACEKIAKSLNPRSDRRRHGGKSFAATIGQKGFNGRTGSEILLGRNGLGRSPGRWHSRAHVCVRRGCVFRDRGRGSVIPARGPERSGPARGRDRDRRKRPVKDPAVFRTGRGDIPRALFAFRGDRRLPSDVGAETLARPDSQPR